MARDSPPRANRHRRRRLTRADRVKRALFTLPVGYYHIFILFITQRLRDVGLAYLQVLRVLKFAAVGIIVAIYGYVVLYALTEVWHVPTGIAFLVEGASSVELSFLGSRYITWRDRRRTTRFWKTLRRYNSLRGVTFAINQGLFNLQIWLFQTWPGFFDFTLHGWYYGNYLANTACIIVSLSFNYTANDEWVFAEEAATAEEVSEKTEVISMAPTAYRPKVAVIIPCKDNDLGPTVEAILGQTYVRANPGKVRIILVGNQQEKSWATVRVRNPELRRLLRFVEIQVHYSPGRDANAKRLRGLMYALPNLDDDDIVWYLDADVEPPRDLLWRIVYRLSKESVVAGTVPSVAREQSGFWQRFIDTAGGKTPYWPHAYRLTSDNLGLNKMPVTANIAVRAAVVRAVGGPEEDFTNSFEDYEWVFRMLRAGFTILCDPALRAPREHRTGFRRLRREYVRSGWGSADYIIWHVVYNLYRVWQLNRLMGVLFGMVVLIVGVNVALAVTLVLGCATVLSRILGTTVRAKVWYAPVFPFLAFFFALCTVYGNASRFYEQGRKRQLPPLVATTYQVYDLDEVERRSKRPAPDMTGGA